MTVTNETLLVVLKAIQSDVAPLKESVVSLVSQAGKIREHMLLTQVDIAKIYEKLAVHELRIAMLEKQNEMLVMAAP